LKRFPSITKRALIKEKDGIHTNFPFKRRIFSETSGSSGEALTFWRSEEWDSATRAAIKRGYAWHGVDPWERNGYFWGYDIAEKAAWKIKLLDTLQNRFRVFSYNTESLHTFIRKLDRAVYLHGYSSMIYEVALIINQEGIDTSGINLKMVKGTSEKIYGSYQTDVQKAFGLKMISEYGAAETGIIAFECPNGNMHVNSVNVIVEVENKEIIVTNLYSHSFPIIRYRLGDYVEMADAGYKCTCGRKGPVIKSILGRVGKSIFGKQGHYPSLTLYYIFKNLAIHHDIQLNYQAVQNQKGALKILVEQEVTDQTSRAILSEAIKYFKNDMDIMIFGNQDLHKKDGKKRDFVSTLD